MGFVSSDWLHRYSKVFVVLLALVLASGSLIAQTSSAAVTIALSPTTSPSSAQPGITIVVLARVSNLSAGTITASSTDPHTPSRSGAIGPSLAATVTAFAALPISGGRITFQVNGPNLTAPTRYLVSAVGMTSTGTSFASVAPASIVIDPPPQIVSLSPLSGTPGQVLQVAIAGEFTNFVQGSTVANFGADISVGGAPFGQSGAVTVTNATTATAQLTINAAAAPSAARSVAVATGVRSRPRSRADFTHDQRRAESGSHR